MKDEDKALVERLRSDKNATDTHGRRKGWIEQRSERREAAHRIIALAAEIEKLREALQGVTPSAYFGESEQHKAWWAKARAALGETK